VRGLDRVRVLAWLGALALWWAPGAALAGRTAAALARRYPARAPAKLRHLKGEPKHLLSYGYEGELSPARAPGLLDWYRPPGVEDHAWLASSRTERLDAATSTWLGFSGYVPTRLAPRILRRELDYDFGGAEIQTEPIDTLERSFGVINRVERMAGGDGRRRSPAIYWQGNVAFAPSPRFVRRERLGILGYLKVTADYAQLRKLDLGYRLHLRDPSFIPARSFLHPRLPPMDATFVALEQAELSAAEHGVSSGSGEHAIEGTFFRTWAYSDARAGFETRDPHKDVAHLKQEVRRLTLALETGFGPYRRYRFVRPLADEDVFRLSSPVLGMLDELFPQVSNRFRYAFPLRPFEQDYARALRLRGPDAAELSRRLARARSAYVEALEQLAASSAAIAEKIDRIRIALAKFAYDSGLHRTLDRALAEAIERVPMR
jgi:hypothetical protein